MLGGVAILNERNALAGIPITHGDENGRAVQSLYAALGDPHGHARDMEDKERRLFRRK